MRNIVNIDRAKNVSRICGHPGIKGFLSRFEVYNIDFTYTDNHLLELDFFIFLWNMGWWAQFWFNDLWYGEPYRYWIDTRCIIICHQFNNWQFLPTPYFWMLFFGSYTFPLMVHSYPPVFSTFMGRSLQAIIKLVYLEISQPLLRQMTANL